MVCIGPKDGWSGEKRGTTLAFSLTSTCADLGDYVALRDEEPNNKVQGRQFRPYSNTSNHTAASMMVSFACALMAVVAFDAAWSGAAQPASAPSSDFDQVLASGRHHFENLKLGGGRRTELQREELRSCVRWSVGLEHESMLVHRHLNGLEEYAVDANKILREMARYGPIHGLSKDQHAIAVKAHDAGAEFSGRKCAGSIDLSFKTMMEAVTTDAREQSFDGALAQVQLIDDTFLLMANSHPFTNRAMEDEDLGPITRPLTGMSNQLGMYQRSGGNWFTCASCDSCNIKDYTGSYHMSLALPLSPEGWVARDESILLDSDTCAPEDPNLLGGGIGATTLQSLFSWLDSFVGDELAKQKQESWIEANMNLANMFQWIEPLLVSVFGTADAEAVCDAGVFTEGSYRSMETGWGVPGSTDVRTFKTQGIGRYVHENFDWMFPNSTEAMPSSYREDLSGCIEEDGMGADIRTRSTINEHHMRPGETLPPMEVGSGIELRIFDNFPIEHVPQVYRMIVFVAEAGRRFTAPEYIYDNDDWVNAIQSVMREGWNAILPKGYVRAMAAALNLPAAFMEALEKNFQAFHVYTELYKALWEAHSEGMWTALMLDDLPEELPALANPNRDSWEIGAINKGITPSKVANLLGLDESHLPHVLKMTELKPTDDITPIGLDSSDMPRVVQITDVKLSDDSCREDVEDFVYLAERFGMVSDIHTGSEGSVESFLLKPSDEWEKRFFTSPVCLSTLYDDE